VVDIYAAVQAATWSGGREVTRMWMPTEKSLPRGSFRHVRGQLQNHAHLVPRVAVADSSFPSFSSTSLIVVNFQSWLDPSIIITALPAALAGIVGSYS